MALLDQQTGDFPGWLKNQSGVTALVGSGTAARIYDGRPKQGAAKPYLLYAVADGDRHVYHGGVASLRTTVLHVYGCADLASTARQLADLVGTLAAAVAKAAMGGTWIDSIRASVPIDGQDPPVDASGTWLFWSRVDVTIVHGV